MTRRAEAAPDPFEAIGCTEVIPIGAGGSSVVYRARQLAFDRLIALKLLNVPVSDDRSRRRFERELALAGRLTGHPNVVTVFASGFLPDGRGYVEMEYCPGGSLADRLAAQGPLPARDVVSIGVKLAGVLELAGRQGIVHRDVKPANVLVTRFGEPALADFGIAVVSGELTGTTQALTPVHAAPEVLETREVGPAADQWSLGSTLHTLLAGRPPFAGSAEEGLLAGMLRVLNDPVPVIPRGDLPAGLRETLEHTMAKDPAARFPGFLALATALQQVERTAGWPVTVLPVEEVPEVRPWASGSGERTGGPVTYALPVPPGEATTDPGPSPPVASRGPGWAAEVADPGPDATRSRARPAAGIPYVAPPPPPPGPASPPGTGTPAGAGPPLASHPWQQAGGPPSAPPALSPPPPVVPFPATPVSGQSTMHVRRRPDPVAPAPAPAPDASTSRVRWWWFAAPGAVVAVAAALVVVLGGSSGHGVPRHEQTLAPAGVDPVLYAPRDVRVIYEAPTGTSITLAWDGPERGDGPFVVQVSDGRALQTTTGNAQTVVTGLQPTKGYCFAVGAVYAVGTPAFSPPVCIRGAVPATTRPTPTTTTDTTAAG
jgi:serine/threonine-protein kinase PknK